MTAPTVARKPRFEPNLIGLQQFLAEFEKVWVLLMPNRLLLEGDLGQKADRFEAERKSFARQAKFCLETESEGRYRTALSFGVNLVKEITEFLEAWTNETAANTRFDEIIAEIRADAPGVWAEHEKAVMDRRAVYTACRQKHDLAAMVEACAQVENMLRDLEEEAHFQKHEAVKSTVLATLDKMLAA